MATIYTYLVIEWQVVGDATKTVQYKDSLPYKYVGPDGAPPSDSLIIGAFIKSLPDDGTRKRWNDAFLNGLVTLVATGQWKATPPPLPRA
jgi:hypothetical protein